MAITQEVNIEMLEKLGDGNYKLKYPLTRSKRTARFVIGTSTAGWTEHDCDYLCDGTADQTEINAAITALPSAGGEILILDGTYNITAKIDVTKNNVSIRGNGNATILKRMFNTSIAEGVITLISRSGCKIADLQIEGNKTSYPDYSNHGIFLTSSSNNTVTGNIVNNNGFGIYLASSSNSNTVIGNTVNNNTEGIYLRSSSSSNTVIGNIVDNSSETGIYLNGVSNNTITGNTSNNNNYGIYLIASNNSTVTGNICIRGTGLSTDYTASQHTIQLNGTGNNYNLISNNNCMGKAVTSGGGTGNTLVNNKFDDSDDIQALSGDVVAHKAESATWIRVDTLSAPVFIGDSTYQNQAFIPMNINNSANKIFAIDFQNTGTSLASQKQIVIIKGNMSGTGRIINIFTQATLRDIVPSSARGMAFYMDTTEEVYIHAIYLIKDMEV